MTDGLGPPDLPIRKKKTQKKTNMSREKIVFEKMIQCLLKWFLGKCVFIGGMVIHLFGVENRKHGSVVKQYLTSYKVSLTNSGTKSETNSIPHPPNKK